MVEGSKESRDVDRLEVCVDVVKLEGMLMFVKLGW